MVRLIVGDAGSGKTKEMISLANQDSVKSNGTIVYIDFSDKHMHQLDNEVRFISISDLNIENFDSMYGFICGLNSSNYDIEKIYIDGLIKTMADGYSKLPEFLVRIEPISEKFDIDIIISATIIDKELLKLVEPFLK